MPKYRHVIQTAENLKSKQDKLHPQLFDENGVMFEHQRQKFLSMADLFTKKNIASIKNFIIKDIVLIGSAASYLYTDKSDFDIKIITDFDKCNPMAKTPASRAGFSHIINGTYYHKALYFRIDGHQVDIKFGADDNYVLGNYSVLHNQWNILPRKDLKLSEIKTGELLKDFYGRLAVMYEKLASYTPQNGIYTPEDLKDSQSLRQLFFGAEDSVRANIDSGLEEYLAFKLIRKFNYMGELAELIIQTTNDRLSLKEEQCG